MKLVVLGASGGCGKHLVVQAAERGHAVTAVARPGSRLEGLPAGVTLLRGDLSSEAFLREAVRGADAVLSALGLRLTSIAPWAVPEVPDFLDTSTPALVAAMKAEGVRRIVAISSGGVGESYQVMPAFFRAFIKASALRTVIPALGRMERVLLDSGLEVCVVRPTGLTDTPATGRVQVATRLTGRATIPRADVAGFMLDELAKPYAGPKTPLITVVGAA